MTQKSEVRLRVATMRRAVLIVLTVLLLVALARAADGPVAPQSKTRKRQSKTRNVAHHRQYAARGLVISVDAPNRSIVISHEAIPGLMEAMAMEFTVRDSRLLESVTPGTAVDFTVTVHDRLYADKIRPSLVQTFESEPLQAARLTLLRTVINPEATARAVPIGNLVPDFALTDQLQKKVELSQLRGRVVAISFAYSRCPNPNYCFRLSNNLARLALRFRDRIRRDLVLLTIVIDPTHDQGAALSEYAAVWKADPSVWHFLTGPISEIRSAAELFGMNFWDDEGLLIHPFHTVVIDRQGKLAANLVGNQFTAEQLGDLVQTVMNQQ